MRVAVGDPHVTTGFPAVVVRPVSRLRSPVVAITRRNAALNLYIAAVTAAGIAVVVGMVGRSDLGRLAGRDPRVFWLFFALFVAGELRPLAWLSGREGGEITASWTFSLGLLCLAPAGVAVGLVAVASAALELRAGKPLRRVVFNTMQVSLALAVAVRILEWLGGSGSLWQPEGPGIMWVVAVLGAGLAALVVKAALTCVVLALSHQLPLVDVARDAASSDWALDLLLVAMTPVLVVVSVRSLVVIPMLLIVIAGVYLSARVGLNHRHEATHDLLTGLPNRRMFFQQAALSLKAAQTRERLMAVMVIDLDGFKEINDRLGHAVGDLALRHVASRLVANRRSADVVARLGGDEFVVLLGGAVDEESARATADRLVEAFKEPLLVDGVPVTVGGSVGLALYPIHGEDIDTLLAHADAAMYQAKTGRLGVHLYDSVLDRNGPTRLGLLNELRRAVSTQDELTLCYQPKIDLATRTVCGVEALIRWNHPTRGHLVAGHFMPIAEQTELMDDITTFVLQRAAAQASHWYQNGFDLPVAVNISARNLMQYRFPEVVAEILEFYRLPADRIELEITENTVTSDPVRAEIVLGRLKQLGVHISVDDFGTGYSSLAHLRSLPIDAIKIDRSFVKDLCTNQGDQVIVRCIIDLANNLGLLSIAEGVEDAATQALLHDMGCPIAQGYYLGMPSRPDAIEQQVHARALLAPASFTSEAES